MSQKKKERHDLKKISILISYASAVVALLASFFITPVILDNVGDSNYGLYSFCASLTTWLTVLTTAIASSYIFFAKREIAKNGNDAVTNQLFNRIFQLFAVLIVVVVLTIPPLLYFLDIRLPNYSLEQSKVIFLLLGISGIEVAVSILFSFYHQYLVSRKEFFFVRGKNLLLEILGYGLNLACAFLFKSIIAIALVTTLKTLLSGVLNWLWASRIDKPQFEKISLIEHKSELWTIIKYVSFVTLNSVVTTINNTLDKTILGFMGYSSLVTIYQLAFSFSTYLLLVVAAVQETYMPQIHEYYSTEKTKEAHTLFSLVTKIQLILMVCIVFGFVACGYDFVLVWVGGERINVYYYAAVLNILSIVPNSCGIAADCERALNKHKFRPLVLVASAILNIIVSVVLAFFLNDELVIWGCIAGTAASKIIAEWIVIPVYDSRVIGLPMKTFFLDFLKIMAIGITSSAIAMTTRHFLLPYLTPWPLLFITGFVYLVPFVTCLFLFERKDIQSFIHGKRNNAISNNVDR